MTNIEGEDKIFTAKFDFSFFADSAKKNVIIDHKKRDF